MNMRTIRFYIQRDVTAFDLRSIGSKVLPGHIGSFYQFLEEALSKHDASKDHPGQHFVVLPKEAYHTVSAGDGLRTGRSEDYIVRNYREGPKMFLKREFAGDVNFLAVVVYTREAFLADPDITDEEREAIGDRSHAIVAVIASSGPSSPLSPYRFVHNLAGGNNAYKLPHPEDEDIETDFGRYADACIYWSKWIVDQAKEIKNYSDKYSTVAD